MGTGYKEIKKRGTSGKAEVRVLKDSVRVVFEDGFSPEFSKDDVLCPLIPGRGLFVQLAKGDLKVQAIRPWAGSFIFRLADFAHKEGTEPTFRQEEARTVTWNDGGTMKTFPVDARLAWTSILEIVDDKEFEGVSFPFTVPYTVDRDNISGNVIVAGDPGNAKKMRDFMEKFGYDFDIDAIPFSANILPMLLDLLLDRGELVSAIVENGYIKNGSMEFPPTGYAAQLKKKAKPKAKAKAKAKPRTSVKTKKTKLK
jgi:hypothetical protein